MTSPDVRRKIFLEEMGLGPHWAHKATGAPQEPVAAQAFAGDSEEVVSPVDTQTSVQPAAVKAEFVHAESRQAEPLQVESLPSKSFQLESVQPESRQTESSQLFTPGVQAASSATSDAGLLPPVSDEAIAKMDWDQLQAAVAGCTRCGLCRTRTRTVFGTGDSKARWLFIGEGPGRNEDLKGEPFIGPAGKLLDNMLLAMGVQRGSNAFIANIVKCRPTDPAGRDRPPSPEETAACLPYLRRQMALIQPEMLVALGKTAAVSLLALDPDTPVGSLRGKVHRYADRPLVVTYHPAYLLRKLSDKKKTWSDLCLAMATHADIVR